MILSIIDGTLAVDQESISAIKEVPGDGTYIHLKNGGFFLAENLTFDEVIKILCPGYEPKPKGKIPVLSMVHLVAGNDKTILAFMNITNCPFEIISNLETVIHDPDGDIFPTEGQLLLHLGDGKFAACDPDEFEAKYELI